MRNKYITISPATAIGIVMLLILLFVSTVSALNVNASEKEYAASDTVTVSGSHTIYISPDKAEIHLGVQTTDKDSKKAQDENAKTVNAIIAKLKELGVKEKSITTSMYNIYQEYDYEKNEPTGFNVSTSLTVKDLEIESVGNILSECVSAGATEIQYISYKCSNYDEEYENALTEAVAAAKKKAEVLAKATGRSVGDVQAIVEGYQDTSARFVNKSYSMGEEAVMAESADVSIMPEDSEITANVTITWYLKIE
jgi:hypothetical protein